MNKRTLDKITREYRALEKWWATEKERYENEKKQKKEKKENEKRN